MACTLACRMFNFSFLIGFWSSFICILYLLGRGIYRRFLKHRLYRPLPPKSYPPPLLPALVARILAADSPSTATTESLEWFNTLMTRLFGFVKEEKPFRDEILWRKLAESAVNQQRRTMGRFFKKIDLSDMIVGPSLPHFSNIRLIREDKDGDVDKSWPLVVACDFDYDGGLSVTLHYLTVLNINLFLLVKLRKLEGPFYIIIDGKAMHFAFSSLEIEFESRLKIVGRESRLINWLFEKYLLPWRMKRRFVLPRMKSRWWIDVPVKPYYPWDEEVIKDPSLLFQERK